MLKDYILSLYDFSCWGRDLILKTAEPLSAEQFDQETRFPIKTVKETLVHTMGAEEIYRKRLMGMPVKALEKSDFADLAAIRDFWQQEEKLMRDFLAGLSEAELLGTVTYTTSRGDTYERVRKDLLTQMFFHSMQHRSELAQMLTEFGHSPGNIDYTLFLDSRK
jgi:uncharacterized damage-inducible protein DinB